MNVCVNQAGQQTRQQSFRQQQPQTEVRRIFDHQRLTFVSLKLAICWRTLQIEPYTFHNGKVLKLILDVHLKSYMLNDHQRYLSRRASSFKRLLQERLGTNSITARAVRKDVAEVDRFESRGQGGLPRQEPEFSG